MKKFYYISTIVLIIVISQLLFLLINLEYVKMPTQWGVAIDWGRHHVVQTGKLLENKISNITWQSGIIEQAKIDVMPKILFAIINIITGTKSFLQCFNVHFYFLWSVIIFVPIVSLYWYKYLSNFKYNNYYDPLLIYIFSIFSLTPTLPSVGKGITNASNTGAKGLFFLLIVFIVVHFFNKKKNISTVILFVLMLVSFYMYYHTYTYYFIIYLLFLMVYDCFIMNNKHKINFYVAGAVIFFAVAVYYNTVLLNEPLSFIKSFSVIINNFYDLTPKTSLVNSYLGYKPLNNFYSYLQLINIVLLLILVFIFIYSFIKNKKLKNSTNKILLTLLIVQLLVVDGMLFVWDGIAGVYARFGGGFLFLTFMSVASMLSSDKFKYKYIIRSILVCVICVVICSSMIKPINLDRGITKEEFLGVKFAGNFINEKSLIFSDFRLGMPLLYYNKLAVKTIDSRRTNKKDTKQLLEQFYYKVNNPSKTFSRLVNSNGYLITSKYQENVSLLDSSLSYYKSATPNFQKKLRESRLNNIYNSKYFNIFHK